MSKNPWFRLYTETVDDEKLRLLAFEDRWHFIALLCCKGSGLLDAGDEPPLMRRKLAVKLGLAPRELEEVARRLEEVGLIDAETFQPLAWDDRQFKSDTSTERVRKYRERMKRKGNVSVTAQETEADTDTEAEQKQKRRSPTGSRLPTDWVLPDDLRAWAEQKRPDLDIDLEAEAFADYWHGAAGAKARKADWAATWRNWIRRADAPRGATRAGPNGQQHPPSKTLTAIQKLQGMKRGQLDSQRDSGRPRQAALPGA